MTVTSNADFAKRMMLLARPAEQFGPTATYDPDGDCIEFLAKPEPFYGERVVRIDEREEADYRQATPGRPSKQTQCVKQTRLHFEIRWELDQAALSKAEREDGLFPLISNDRTLSAEQVARAYKRQLSWRSDSRSSRRTSRWRRCAAWMVC